MTRLGVFRILGAKAAALLVEQAPALTFLAAHLALVMWMSAPGHPVVLLSLPGFALSLLLSIVVGFYYSLYSKHIATSAALTALSYIFAPLAASIIVAFTYFGICFREKSAATSILFIEAGVVLALMLVLAATRGCGATLALLAHVFLMVAVIAVFMLLPREFGGWGWSDDMLIGMPIGGWTAGVETPALLDAEEEIVLAGAVFRLAVLVWMSALLFIGFERQMRRAY
jgi:hypothetical protein